MRASSPADNTPAPTLDEVAATAGVSRSTASRAINGGLRVSPEAMAAVEAAAERLGYIPNHAARSLVNRRTDSIALVIPEPDEWVLSDPFIGGTLRGVNAALAATNKQLILLIARPGESGGRIAQYLRSGYVDGAVIVSHHRDNGLEQAVLSARVPAVFIGRPFQDEDQLHYTDVDNTAGGRIATQHLIELGRQRIAHVGGPQDMTAGLDRAQGWREALDAANLPSDLLKHGNFTSASGQAIMTELLSQEPDIDAVFVASDLIAMGVLNVLKAHNRKVPDDVAVIGFDDLGVAADATPPLSTVRNPVLEMSAVAVRQLLQLLDPQAPALPTKPHIFMPELVLRNSSETV